MVPQPIPQARWHVSQSGQVSAHFHCAVPEAGFEPVQHLGVGSDRGRQLLPLQRLQMLHGHLQDIRLLQFRMARWLQRRNGPFEIRESFFYNTSVFKIK